MAALGAASRRRGGAARRADAPGTSPAGAAAARPRRRCARARRVPAAGQVRAARRRFRARRRRGPRGGSAARPRRAAGAGPWRRRRPHAEADARAGHRGAGARDSGDLGKRAAGVLARVEWPGKPGAAAPAAPLTPDGAGAVQRRAGQCTRTCAWPAISRTDAAARSSRPRLVGSEFALGAPADSRPRPAERQGGRSRPDAAARRRRSATSRLPPC